MKPSAKRAKVGRTPHDALTDSNNSNKMSSKTGKKGTGNTKTNHADEDDEIAMDPEDYAMKVDPEYRLDRNRAVADNKLKSAFELLFEKYSQDFGDTGDEINFYTDEIEVDNGHIASLPVERPSKQGDGHSDENSDEGGDDNNGQPALSAAAKASSSRLVASLLPSRFGPIGTVIMGGSALGVQGLVPGEIDPTWAAPEIPDVAFSTQGGGAPFVPPPPPPRNTYAAPQRTVFTKALPTSYGRDLGEDGEDEDDDLILDTPKPTIKDNRGEESSPSNVLSKQAAYEPKSIKKRRKRTLSGPSATDEAKQAANTGAASKQSKTKELSPKTRRGGRNSKKAATPTERTSVPDSASPEPPLSDLQNSAPLPPSLDETAPTDGSSSPAPGSLPTPLDEEGNSGEQPATSSTKSKPKETFKRNMLDPIFVFSDDEDFGLKKRTRPQPVPMPATAPVSGPHEEARTALEEAIQAASILNEDEVPLEAPVAGKKEKKRPGRSRKSGGITEAYLESTSEVAQISSLPEAQRREAQSLSIIIMTSGKPPSTRSTLALATIADETESATEVEATIETDAVSEPMSELTAAAEPTTEPVSKPAVELTDESVPEIEPEPEISPAAEPTAERASEPGAGPADEVESETEDAAAAHVAASTPSPLKAASDEQPRKRKHRRQTVDGSSPVPSSQKSSKMFKSSQKSSSSVKSKAGRHRTREIPDSQSFGSSGIISLVSDGSADEAEVDKITQASPRLFVPGSGGRQPVSANRRSSAQTTPTRSKQTTPSSRRRIAAAEALMATPSRHRHHSKAGRLTPTVSRLLLLSPLARRQQAGTGSAASSPGGSPIQTPGGSLRRCGKDGFRCEREFCFRCI